MNEYVPPKVWTWDKENGGAFASTNRPIAGATHDKDLPRGAHPIQLYSLATPNGQKVTILLEELLAAGRDAEYDAYLVNIGKGDQFGSGFVSVNPNSKIPAMVDYGPKEPIRLFESGSMMVYLADKFDAFLSKDVVKRAETMNWLFWQMGSAPFLGGGFGHFYAYAPVKLEYPINRYAMETKRQLDVLDRQLAEHEFVSGSDYTIADMAIFPWYGGMVLGRAYDAAEFLDVGSYTNVIRWAKQVDAREAVKRGRTVNAANGPEDEHLYERHSAADIDKVVALRKDRGTV
ncbi:glutathione-dependent disulfide-bond oxidoreductase [Devosia sp. XJ19-1]|uniref:Glutathione-dependent disulfide-bond oxidoreductase n=1 Tax=Devosia ureilytica TaxID=2952754 RepID=A0A9Q4AP86_9HYPH|nr:glutathione-dependent disulfide-bond oxidoreductase [Devosia ureilytica]MCP8883821.1 glutathione-dependent disulfide-bond oxidoreductase [Devosia ureilytica]MCP8887429.1 glutathione-dependent disulfide-bond oxidoreductase [Devosia ureilytica]